MTQQLSAAIAASGNEWQKPGVRVVDPVTEAAWRLSGRSWRNAENSQADVLLMKSCMESDMGGPSHMNESDAQNRAIAAGPDWHDDATVGVLLGLMPDLSIRAKWEYKCNELPRIIGWWAESHPPLQAVDLVPTRNEAIARAYLASKGAT